MECAGEEYVQRANAIAGVVLTMQKDIRGLEVSKQKDGGVIVHLAKYSSSSAFESPTASRVIFTHVNEKERVYTILLEWMKRLKGISQY